MTNIPMLTLKGVIGSSMPRDTLSKLDSVICGFPNGTYNITQTIAGLIQLEITTSSVGEDAVSSIADAINKVVGTERGFRIQSLSRTQAECRCSHE